MAICSDEIPVGTQRALRVDHGSARVLFGLGPPRDSGSREQRLEELLTASGLGALRWCEQLHGTGVVAVDRSIPDPVARMGSHDGLITAETDLGLVVWTADCVPIVLCGERVVAAIHAGWRGTAAGIVPAALKRISTDFSTGPNELVAFLGPAISARHYRVGSEVILALAKHGAASEDWLRGDRVDLRAFLGSQLRMLGLQRVERVGPCTAGTPELASYRRDGAAAGRQWSVVWRMGEG